MSIQHDMTMPDGRTVRAYDTGEDGPAGTLVWHHGTPQTGRLLDPIVAEAGRRGLRVISCARPAYPGSSPRPGRSVADAADDVLHVVAALGIERFATMGASGGGPEALACAALAPERVSAVVVLAGSAPFTEDIDWFAGMASPDALRAAGKGRAERARHAETAVFDESSFTAADWRTLSGAWRVLGEDAQRAEAAGPDGAIDDDVAYMSDWGVDLTAVRTPVLLVQGGEDRVVPAAHARWMLDRLPLGELWFRPRDGHVSVLESCPVALDWIREGSHFVA